MVSFSKSNQPKTFNRKNCKMIPSYQPILILFNYVRLHDHFIHVAVLK